MAAVLANSTLTCTRLLLMALCMPPIVKVPLKPLIQATAKRCGRFNLAEKDGWFSRAPALLSGGVTVSGGHVYIGSEKAKVYALNTSDGTVAWEASVAGEAISRPVVSDGMVLIHTTNRSASGAERSRWRV
ncbi:outer membrane protein YfgL [Klebsiella michiganensis]|uniref:Outer membrane protein YfgL n=1 Tax=Klebsiella michiganensis TaxID=1134687 RepID=A0A7H4PNF5_9ENTR|nr:outer membrane protein YfgL [Klebsiella michiganensis]